MESSRAKQEQGQESGLGFIHVCKADGNTGEKVVRSHGEHGIIRLGRLDASGKGQLSFPV